jgi:cation:H+ antiporter
MLNLLFLVTGFVPLIYGANLLVDSASALAKRFNIPNIVIGLTIVAFGTSAPEMVVNVLSSLEGKSDLSLGNIIGSNIFNTLVILGIASIIFPLTVKSNTTWIEIPLALLAATAVLFLANDKIIDGAAISSISRIDGLILLLFFAIFMAYNIVLMKGGGYEEDFQVKSYSPLIAGLLILAGLALIIAGGKIIVESAVRFAQNMGISERIIGLTIVAAGTSLPELATSIVAARKRNVDIAIGNVVGSNLFNIFFVLGISSIINPVIPQTMSNLDMMVNLTASVLLFLFIFTGKGRRLDRWEGAVLLTVFIAYTGILITT